MINRKSRFLNRMFLLIAFAGFLIIFNQEKLDSRASFLIPMSLVFVYSLIVKSASNGLNDFDLAEHHTESIYFLGFLFTLISLAVLFYRFSTDFFGMESAIQISETFHFIGISVTTSIAGVLMRNLIRPGVLSHYSSDDDSLEKSFEILKTIVSEFSTGYKNTFENLEIFLDERRNNAALLDGKEKEYLAALDGFVEATGKFSTDLRAADNSLVNHVDYYLKTAELQSESISSLNEASKDLAESTLRIRSDIEMIPMVDVAENIRTLGAETGELNTVIDSLLEIMDHKLERVG
ncbi:MAG: hypothetical protein PF693_00675 [Spirochaetia bacterium]|jgi:hypothetical protein|nr:hypothetical protein [Spirochaetia bacterium]